MTIKFIKELKMRIKIKWFLLFSLFSFNCCSKSDIHISDKFIKEIATINNENSNGVTSYIPEEATSLLYFKLSTDKIACTNALELQDVYNSYYKNDYKNFYTFLNNVLNQKINIDINKIHKNDIIVFDLENNILNKSSDLIIKQYFKKNDNGIYYFYPKNLTLNLKQTLLYKMFINNYLISYEDYGGKYLIVKAN